MLGILNRFGPIELPRTMTVTRSFFGPDDFIWLNRFPRQTYLTRHDTAISDTAMLRQLFRAKMPRNKVRCCPGDDA